MPDAGGEVPPAGVPSGTWPIHERRSARARHVRVEVRRDGTVWLIIPQRANRAEALAFLATRRGWIERARRRLGPQPAAPTAPPLAWDGSSRLPLAGRDVPVLHIVSRSTRPRVRFTEARIEVYAPPHSMAATLEHALRAALRERARVRATHWLDTEAARLDVAYRGPRIADQRSRWGSCAASGLISLNWRLVLAPEDALRYVVVHELCHCVHSDHSARFWALVGRQMPGWAGWRRWLRDNGAGLHALLPAPRSAGCPSAPAAL